MNQQALFTKPATRDRRSAALLRANEHQAENIRIARQALADPDRYGWLQAWAAAVVRNARLRAESEAA
jgi:hypothetical protein